MIKKSLKENRAAEAIRVFGGSPIRVAVPPTFERTASAISRGMGFIRSLPATNKVTGAMRIITVILFKNMEMTAVRVPRRTSRRQGEPWAC